MVWVRMLLVLGLLLAAGCEDMLYPRFDKKMWATYIHLNEVSMGMSKSEVEGVIGPPGIREEGDFRGGRYTFYFYLTHDRDQEGSGTVRGGYTPLVFKDSRLVGIGKRAYDQATDKAIYTDDYPNLPWRTTK